MTAPRDPAPAGPRHVAREFWTGLTEPSGLAFLTTLASLLAAAAGALWFFSAPVLSGPLGKYLARSPKDTEAQATYRALQLSRDPGRDPQLLILGSSAIASAVDSEPALEQELKARTGQDWSASLLATPLQTSLDQITLSEVALGPPPGPPRPVVIAIELGLIRERASLPRLLDLEQRGRLGLRSAWADQAVRELGGTPRPRFGIYAFDNSRFVILNGSKALMRLAIDRPAPRRLGDYAPPAPLPASKRARARLVKQFTGAEPDSQLVYVVLAKLLRRLKDYPNVRVVIIESKLSPDFLASTGTASLDVKAQAKARAFAEANGAAYWPIITEAQVPAAAYYDDLHIATPAEQARVRAALAKHVAEAMGGSGS